MSDPINPYAVPATVEDEAFHAVHFGGTATYDDLRMVLHDAPPAKGFARVKGPMVPFLLIAILLFMFSINFEPGEPISSSVWLLSGFLLLPGWLHMARILTPGRRKRVARIDRMAPKQTQSWGWIEQAGVVLCDHKSVLKAKWEFFATAMIFPEHLMLPLNSDANHRVVLPWRYFASPDDAKSVIEYLHEHHKAALLYQPKPETLVDQTSQCDGYVHSDIEQAKQWSKDNWPLKSDPVGQFDCEIDVAAVMSTRRFALYSTLVGLFIIGWYFLPIWAAIVGWLIYEYSFFGGWDLFGERLGSSLLMIIPTSTAIAFFAYAVFKNVMTLRKNRKQPMNIRLRKSGVHLSHESFQSWFEWSVVKEVINREDQVGWLVEETGDEIVFPKICFENEATFARCKEVLNEYGPKK